MNTRDAMLSLSYAVSRLQSAEEHRLYSNDKAASLSALQSVRSAVDSVEAELKEPPTQAEVLCKLELENQRLRGQLERRCEMCKVCTGDLL